MNVLKAGGNPQGFKLNIDGTDAYQSNNFLSPVNRKSLNASKAGGTQSSGSAGLDKQNSGSRKIVPNYVEQTEHQTDQFRLLKLRLLAKSHMGNQQQIISHQLSSSKVPNKHGTGPGVSKRSR